MTYGRTHGGGGKWKIVQCSVRPETAKRMKKKTRTKKKTITTTTSEDKDNDIQKAPVKTEPLDISKL